MCYFTKGVKANFILKLKFQLSRNKSHLHSITDSKTHLLHANFNFLPLCLNLRSAAHFKTNLLLELNFPHVSLRSPHQTSTHILLLILKFRHSCTMPCFAFHSSLNNTNIIYIETLTLPIKISICFREQAPNGTHYSKISTIL